MKTTIKAGKYVITDPCYVYPYNEWIDFCDQLWTKEKNQQEAQIMSYNNTEFIVIPTAFGDGCYPIYKDDQEVAVVGVDAGLLSIIPLELFGQGLDGYVIELTEDVEFEAKGGDFIFGNWEVVTNGENDPDYENDF